MNNQVILKSKASLWKILTSDITDPEWLITILLLCRKTLRGHCNVGDKISVGDSVTTKVVITVGEGKYNGEKRMTLELEIFNLNV